jgi:hypothetical protein
MKDRTLQGIITVIPVFILLVSFLLPFGANGWDIGATILPADSFMKIGAGLLTGIGGGVMVPPQGSVVPIFGSGISEDGSRVFLNVMLKNPLPMPLDVKEFSGSIPAGGTVISLTLMQPVSIPSGGSTLIRLEGTVPQGLRYGGLPLPSRPTLGDLKMRVSCGGIPMTLDENAIRGMVS